jgi:hypothetical protein
VLVKGEQSWVGGRNRGRDGLYSLWPWLTARHQPLEVLEKILLCEVMNVSVSWVVATIPQCAYINIFSLVNYLKKEKSDRDLGDAVCSCPPYP